MTVLTNRQNITIRYVFVYFNLVCGAKFILFIEIFIKSLEMYTIDSKLFVKFDKCTVHVFIKQSYCFLILIQVHTAKNVILFVVCYFHTT